MTPLATKILGVSAGVAGLTAIGVTTFYLTPSSSKTISKSKVSALLTGKRLLTKGSEDHAKWATPWSSFKAKYSNNAPSLPWNFSNWTQNKVDNNGFDSFKEHCISLGSSEVENKNNDIFSAVDAYCTTTDLN